MRLHHVAMYVKNIEKAKEFFVKYLDGCASDIYRNQETGFQSYFITFDDEVNLEIMSRPNMEDVEKSPARTGFIHVAFSLGSREAVDKLTKRLEEDGYDVISGPRTTGDGFYESCVAIMEENIIELTV